MRQGSVLGGAEPAWPIELLDWRGSRWRTEAKSKHPRVIGHKARAPGAHERAWRTVGDQERQLTRAADTHGGAGIVEEARVARSKGGVVGGALGGERVQCVPRADVDLGVW